jgi:hypothetical protein
MAKVTRKISGGVVTYEEDDTPSDVHLFNKVGKSADLWLYQPTESGSCDFGILPDLAAAPPSRPYKAHFNAASTATVSPFRCASRTRLWKGGSNERIVSATSTVAHHARGAYRGLVLNLGPNYDPESNYARTQSAELGQKVNHWSG